MSKNEKKLSREKKEIDPKSLIEEYEENASVIEEYEEYESSSLLQSVHLEEHQVKKRFDRYQILETLGWGGMGIVYKAKDLQTQKTIALKIMHSSEQSKQEQRRFLREAKATAKLDHPNIVKVYDIGYDQDQFFFTMDFILGVPLKEFYQNKNTTLVKISRVAIAIARGVSYAHKQGLIHRDLKPANIMINSEQQPIIMDFGLVKTHQESTKLSKTGAMLGTLQYMPPEQIDGSAHVDERSDLYSLGVTLYEMLVKKPPFESSNQIRLMYKVIEGDFASPKELDHSLPDELVQACLKAMAKKKEDRYQSVEEFIDALDEFLCSYLLEQQLGE